MPKGIINSILYSVIFGYIMVCSFVLAMNDPVAAAKDGGNVFFNLFAGLSVPSFWKDVLYVLIVVANYLCSLACVTSTSRMIFAFSRDGGVPLFRRAAKGQPDFRTPIGGIWATVSCRRRDALFMPIMLWRRVRRSSSIFPYAMPLAPGSFRVQRLATVGPFQARPMVEAAGGHHLPRRRVVTWIGLQPPNDIVTNYAIGILVLLVVGWFALERKRFPGPPISAADIAKRHDEIAAEEQRLARRPAPGFS